MDIRKIRKPRKFLIVFVLAGFVFLGLTVKLYEETFGHLRASTTVWGEFGSFFGGVLGPIFSFLAFIGLLWTISLNYEQLSFLSDEKDRQRVLEKKEDLYKVIESIHNRLNNTLKENLFCEVNTFKMYTDIAADTSDQKNTSFMDLISDIPGLDLSSIVDNYHVELVGITRLILALKMYASEYENISNDRILSGFYRMYYLDVAFLLQKLKMIDQTTFDFYDDLSFERNLLKVRI